MSNPAAIVKTINNVMLQNKTMKKLVRQQNLNPMPLRRIWYRDSTVIYTGVARQTKIKPIKTRSKKLSPVPS
jgi:hypothetical protein